jgi:hypothetical protein
MSGSGLGVVLRTPMIPAALVAGHVARRPSQRAMHRRVAWVSGPTGRVACYIETGALIPISPSVRASTTRVASSSSSRAFVRSGSSAWITRHCV